MGRLLASSICLVALFFGVRSQTCSSTLPTNCYYSGAGTISANGLSSYSYFAIGGLFDIHERDDKSFCGSKITVDGMSYLMAFYWSINKYSKEILPNDKMEVGAIAFDNCMRPEQTIENMLSFSQCKVQVQGLNQQNVIAYVGPYSNMDAYRTGMLANDLKMTLVSPAASSLGMYNENQKSLLRARPSMAYDIKAILGFLKHESAEFVLIVYSKEYQYAYDEMTAMLKKKSLANDMLCHQEFGIMTDDDSEIEKVALDIKKYNVAKYVVALTSKAITKELMKKTVDDNNLIFILHSDIGMDKDCVKEHAIIVEPVGPSGNDLATLNEFNTFLKNVNTNAQTFADFGRNDVYNPWLPAFIEQRKQDASFSLPDLMTEPGLRVPSPMLMNIWRTIDSVRTIISGMHKAITTSCSPSINNYQFCDQLRNLDNNRDEIFDAIKDFGGFGNDGQARPVDYNYYIYSRANSFVKIGHMQGNSSAVIINENLQDTTKYGQDFSGSLCPATHECCHEPTTPVVTNPATDAPTTDAPIEPSSDKIQVWYPKDKEITGAFSNMDRDSDDYGTRFDVGQKWIIALGVLAGLGILCVLVFEIYILYKMVGKKVDNKWRTMWLGQLLLFGIFLAYLVCFAYIFIPTKTTCGITRFGVGVAYAICFAVLLVKLMVILTSKSSDVLMPGDMDSPNYLKGVYQFLMFVFAVGVQIVINVQWLITVPPEAVQVLSNSGDKVWVCNHYTWKTGEKMFEMDSFVRTNFENHLMSLTYIMIMILIITILSLNAHGIITNHRESVFIGIAAGFSIPLWLAWGLVGGLNIDKDYGHEYGDACIAFGLFLTATLILFAMFLPKVRQLVNMGVEGIYLEDDRETIYGGSIIMAPPSYKSKGGAPSSVIYVNNQGIYSEPVVIGNGDTTKLATHLKHPMSTYSAPPTYLKKTESTYGGSRVLRVTDDLKGRHPSNRSTIKKPLSEVNYASSGRPRSHKGTLPRSRSQSDLGAL